MPDDEQQKPSAKTAAPAKHHRKPLKTRLKIIGFGLLFLILAVGAYTSYVYAATPAPIRTPAFQHYHFRMQVIADGKAADFSHKEFQMALPQSCGVDLTAEPIHFHDGKSQMTHIHWDGITGGMVLKYYGWDHIGGLNGALGYRFDQLPLPKKVPVHGNLLPEEQEDAKLYVYTGDENSYTLRSADDFLRKDLESFFGKRSNIPGGSKSSLLDRIFPKASAHAGHEHGNAESDTAQQLEEINNLLGNVVIFSQKDKPTPAQVQAKFDQLEPLSASTCGG
jgi:hypothetical protein